MAKPIYLIDTNILCQWLAAYVPSSQNDNPYFQNNSAIRIKRFMEKENHTIYVPDVIWAEFLGVALHKDMDVNGDLNQLQLWFRNREIYIQQMLRLIFSRHHFFQWPTMEKHPHIIATYLSGDRELVDASTFKWLKKKAERNQGKTKLLDGMDAVILVYLDALAQRYPERQVVLYTADHPLAKIVPRVREHYRDWFAQNVIAEYALGRHL